MKIRTDFVTNSSSSSYIVAYKDLPSLDAETMARYPFLSKFAYMMERMWLENADCGGADEVPITSIEALNRQYLWACKPKVTDPAMFNPDTIEYDYHRKDYDQCVEYLNKGYKILFKSIHRDNHWSSFGWVQRASDSISIRVIDD